MILIHTYTVYWKNIIFLCSIDNEIYIGKAYADKTELFFLNLISNW